MHSSKRSFLLLCIGALGIFLPLYFASADYVVLAPLPGLGSTVAPNSFGSYANTFITLIIGFSAVMAVLMIMVGGFMYMTGEAIGTKSEGKKYITNAIYGLILLLASYLILNTVNPQLLNLNLVVAPVNTNVTGGLGAGTPTPTVPNAYCYVSGQDIGESGAVPTSGCSSTLQACQAAQAHDGTAVSDCAPLQNFTPVLPPGASARSNVSADVINAALAAYAGDINAAAAKYGVDPAFLKAIIYYESGGNTNATSPAGAYGLGQFLPSTARGLDPVDFAGMTDAQIADRLKSDPTLNIYLTSQYLSQGLQAGGGSIELAAAYHNGGPPAIQNSTVCPGQIVYACTANSGYKETRVYVPSVVNLYQTLKG